MPLATVMSRASVGIDSPPVQVEVHITGGLPKFAIAGLPEATLRESKDRIRSAIINSRFDFPRRRITVNLAPVELPKEGSRYDPHRAQSARSCATAWTRLGGASVLGYGLTS